MASSTTHRKMEAGEFFQLPEGPPYFELINGELFMSPSPGRRHQEIATNLTGILWSYLKANPIGKVFSAPSDVLLSPELVLEPDLYFVSKNRLDILSDRGVDGAPDLVVEILSPSTASLDRGAKKEAYAQAGVKEMWVICPEREVLFFYDFSQEIENPVATIPADGTLSSNLISGLELPLKDVFAA